MGKAVERKPAQVVIPGVDPEQARVAAEAERRRLDGATTPAVADLYDRLWESLGLVMDGRLMSDIEPDARGTLPTHAAIALVDGLAALVQGLAIELVGLRVKLDAIETRGFDYRGVWQSGTYPEGCFVTDHGGLWYSKRQTDRRPGDGDSGWTLAVKAGRDRSSR